MSLEWSIALLGTQRVRVGARNLELSGPRQQRLLAVLALEANQAVSFNGVLDALWDEDPPDTAHRQVHNAVAALRRALGPVRECIVTVGRGYRLEIAPETLDFRRFLLSVGRARRAIAAGRSADASADLSEGLALWQGPALAGLSGRAIRVAAAHLEEERLAATEMLFRLRLEEGAGVEIIPALRTLVQEHPLRDRFREQLMLALYRAGRQAEALEVYEAGRVLLADELGLDMRAEVRELHGRILRADPTLDARRSIQALDPVSAPVDAADDDEGTEDEPTADVHGAVSQPCGDRSFLPRDIPAFIGRADEYRRLVALGEDGARRSAPVVASVDGMAGVGKTALALRVAHSLAEHYPDGQFFVDLHGHTPGREPVDPAQALEQLLRDVGVPPDQVPSGLEQRSAAWRAALATRRALTLVDNALDAEHARPLLPGSGGTMVLITSRRKLLDLDADTAVSLEVLSDLDAMQLFEQIVGVERTAGEPDAVADIARLCGHLPLAIRIAAARLRHRRAWTVAHLAERLREGEGPLSDLVAGDRSVATAFEISYRQLDHRQRLLFWRLGLHVGRDFDADGAAALCAVPRAEAEDLLEELFDRNLLGQRVQGRYYFHDLIRRYAYDKARAEEPPQERTAHVSGGAPYIRRPPARESIDRPVVQAQIGPVTGSGHRPGCSCSSWRRGGSRWR